MSVCPTAQKVLLCSSPEPVTPPVFTICTPSNGITLGKFYVYTVYLLSLLDKTIDIQYIGYYYQKRLWIYSISVIIIRKDFIYTVYWLSLLEKTMYILYI